MLSVSAADVLLRLDESYDAFDGLGGERDKHFDEERGERGRGWEEGRASHGGREGREQPADGAQPRCKMSERAVAPQVASIPPLHLPPALCSFPSIKVLSEYNRRVEAYLYVPLARLPFSRKLMSSRSPPHHSFIFRCLCRSTLTSRCIE